MTRWQRRALLGLVAVAAAVPLGLLAEGAAWGEWGPEELRKRLGWVPRGLARLAELWPAPLPDYTVAGLAEPVGYVLSAVLGAAVVGGAAWILVRALAGPGR